MCRKMQYFSSYLIHIINSRPHHGSSLLKMKQTNYIDTLDKSFRTETNQFTKCSWNDLATSPPCTPTTLSSCTAQPHPVTALAKVKDPIKTLGPHLPDFKNRLCVWCQQCSESLHCYSILAFSWQSTFENLWVQTFLKNTTWWSEDKNEANNSKKNTEQVQ